MQSAVARASTGRSTGSRRVNLRQTLAQCAFEAGRWERSHCNWPIQHAKVTEPAEFGRSQVMENFAMVRLEIPRMALPLCRSCRRSRVAQGLRSVERESIKHLIAYCLDSSRGHSNTRCSQAGAGLVQEAASFLCGSYVPLGF